MKFKRPEITENYQLEIVECKNQTIQDVINGAVLALLVFGPITLITSPI